MERTGTSGLAGKLIALRGQRQDPHALRTVAVVGEVEYVAEAAGAALEDSLRAMMHLGSPLVWVADAGRVAEMGPELEDFLRAHADGVVCYGTADPARMEAFCAALPFAYHAQELRTAVFAARELAVPGGRVLFSPAGPGAQDRPEEERRATVHEEAVRDL